MKIVFIGTPEFGAIILKRLAKHYKPVLVITQPDKPGNRKQITCSEVKKTAQEHNIPISYSLKDIKEPDLIILAAFSQILPKEILEMPKYGSLNVHPSLLPKYRGASPIQQTILNNDKETGVTVYLMDEKMDHGKIISFSKIPVPKTTYQKLSQKLAELGADLLIETIPKWINKEIKAKPQNEAKASYTKLIKKQDAKIDWNKPANKIERQIRAFHPWPGAFTFFKKQSKVIRTKILEADVSKDPEQLSVKCKKDYLIIKKLQPEGKKPITGKEFLRGYNGFNIIL